MAHGWNPYLHNFSSLPSDHGTPDSQPTHPHPADDFIGHGGLSSANIPHGASTANRNYCFSNRTGNNSTNWSPEIGHSQRNYREMAWQTEDQKAYLPRWDSSVSNFEANVLETGHCPIAPQTGLKQDAVVPKGSPYFSNYMNAQGPPNGVSEPQLSYEFMTKTSEHNPQTEATARYHSPWLQTPTGNASTSSHCTYSNVWPNLTEENANKSIEGGSKSLENEEISFESSYKYTDSKTLGMENFDTNSKQICENTSQKANVTENYKNVCSQELMDGLDSSETNEDKNLASAQVAFTDYDATNAQIYPTNNSLPDSDRNENDDHDYGLSQSSSKSSVSNDIMNSDDNDGTSNDSQSSFHAKSVSEDNKDVKVAESPSKSSVSNDIINRDDNSTDASNDSQSSFHAKSGSEDKDVKAAESSSKSSVCNDIMNRDDNSTDASNDSQSSFHAKSVSEDNKDVKAAEGSSKSSVSNDIMNRDDNSTDASNDSQSSFHDKSVSEDNKDDNKDVKAADCSDLQRSASDASPTVSRLYPDSTKDENVSEEQAVTLEEVVTTFSISCSSDPSASSLRDTTDESDTLTGATASCKDSCDAATIDCTTNKNPFFDSTVNLTLDSKTESDTCHSPAKVTADDKTLGTSLCATPANVNLIDGEETHAVQAVTTDELNPEEKGETINADNVEESCTEPPNEDCGQNIDSNQETAVFDAEQGLVENSLIETQSEKSTSPCSTPHDTCTDPTNDQSAENEHSVSPNLEMADREPQLPKTHETQENTAPENKIQQDSPENGPVTSCESPSRNEIQKPEEATFCLESEMPEHESLTGENDEPDPSDEEHFEQDEFGRPLTPEIEIEKRPEYPEMKPSSKMLKVLQPIVLITTMDGEHLTRDNYTCAQCSNTTSSVDELIEHHIFEHPTCDFQLCKTCGIYFVPQGRSRKHVCGQESTVVSSRPVKRRLLKQFCSICKLYFLKWNHFISHMRTHTGKTPYRCEICKEYFSQKSTLNRHLKKSCSDKPSPLVKKRPQCESSKPMNNCYVKLYDITKTLFCKFCGKTFPTSKKVSKHVYNVHKKPNKNPKPHKEIFKTEEAWPEKKNYKCPLCPLTFPHHLKRNGHFKNCLKATVFGRSYRVGIRYKCPLCLATFSMSSNRYRHVYQLCQRNFLSFLGKNTTIPNKLPRYSNQMKTVLSKLKAEEDRLNGQPSGDSSRVKPTSKLKCDICSAVFRNKYAKCRHRKTHTIQTKTDTEPEEKKTGSIKLKYSEKSLASKGLKKQEFTQKDDRLYNCSQCGKVFKSRVVLAHHKITHQRKIQCTVCKEILPTIGELIQHRTTHLNRGLLQCPDCPRKFAFPVYLVRHIRLHLKTQNQMLQEDDKEIDSPSETSDTRHRCHLCNEAFEDTESLKRHYFTHIPVSSLQCPFCKRKFSERKYVLRHVSRHFGGKRLSKEDNFKVHHQIVQPSKDEQEKTGDCVCRYCSRKFLNKGHLMKHYQGHYSQTLSKCPTCNLYFGYSKVGLHKRMCAMGATGSRSQITKSSLVNKRPEKKYQCQHCPQTFKYPSLYYRHLSSHKGLEVHACIICGKGFPTMSMCSRHEASCEGLYKCDSKHSKKAEIVPKSTKGEFKCKFCNKVFSKSRNLRRHILTHNEVKPYRCKTCDRCFSRYDHLKIHLGCCSSKEKLQLNPQIRIPKINLDKVGKGLKMESELGDFTARQCKICLRKYSSVSRLKWHISLIHSVKHIKCMKCGALFSSEKSLRDHTRYRRCTSTTKGETQTNKQQNKAKQTQIKMDSPEKQNVILARLQPTSQEGDGKAEIKCDFCHRTFRTNAHLKVHMVLHGEKYFVCDCGKRFFKRPHLLRHMDKCEKKRNSTPSRGFSCAYCTCRFLLFSQLQEHFLNAHKAESKNEPVETTPLQQHLSNLQQNEENVLDVQVPEQPKSSNLAKLSEDTDFEMDAPVKESPYPCKKCKRGFWNKTTLRNHYRKCWRKASTEPVEEDTPLRADIDMVLDDSGTETSSEEEFEDPEPPNKSSLEKKTVYQCSECDKSFTDGLLLISHLEDHGREEQEKRQNKCIKCGRTFLNQARLEKHIKAIHESAEVCKECFKEFASQTELEIHKKQAHNPSNPYCCRLCNYRFPNRNSFTDHCSKMHPENIFSCRKCNRNYTLQTSLIRHNRKWHPKLKEGSETSLGAQSSSESEAAPPPPRTRPRLAPPPVRTQTGGGDDDDVSDNDDDDDDGISGSDSDSADSDSAPYFPCHVCGKTFTTSESLEDHQRCHLGEKPHECAQCGQCFFLPGQLLQHERKHKSEFQCKICGRGFVSLFALRKHKHTSGKKRPYKCSKCLLYFTTPALLAEHKVVIHREESFPCDICNRVFPSKISRAEHRKIHTPKSSPVKPPEESFPCDICNRVFPSKISRAEHRNIHMPKSSPVKPPEESFPCDICNRVFTSKISRAVHRKMHMPKSSPVKIKPEEPVVKDENNPVPVSVKAANELKYRCGVCCLRFKNPEELSEHGCLAGTERPYSCSDCDKHFLHPSHLKKHLSRHKAPLSQSKYACNQCTNSFTSPQDFLNHLRNHDGTTLSGEGFVCPVCHQCFTSAAELTFHFPNHPSGILQCKTCNKTFPNATQLKEHEVCHEKDTRCKKCGQNAHDDEHDCSPRLVELMNIVSSFADEDEIDVTGEDLCFCPFCPMQFSSRSNLLEHQNRLHPNEKTYACEVCARTYARQTDLDKHMLKHRSSNAKAGTSQVKFKCSQCPMTFNSNKDLSVHLKLHAAEKEVGEYRCDMCYKSFNQPHLLRQHQESHVGQIVYECTECDKAFAFPHLLEEHQKSHV